MPPVSRFSALTQVRAFTAVLVFVAIVAQLKTTADAGALNPVNFFSFFTIQSNLIGAAVLLYLVFRAGQRRSARVEWWRGAAAVYLTVAFAVVVFLPSNLDFGLQLPWVDVVLHKIVPVIIVADYLIDPPTTRLTLSDGLLWLVYPLAWLGYAMVRGPIAGWYPYPFLDPAKGGYGPVAVTVVAILIAGAVLCAAYVWLANVRGGSRSGGPAA